MSLNKKASEYLDVTGGDYWTRKMRTLFRRLDHDGCGLLVLDDFLDIATMVITNFPKLSDYCGDEVVKAVVNLWFGYVCTHVPESKRTNVTVSETEFVDNIKNAVNGPLKNGFHDLIVRPFFESANTTNDGKLILMDFRAILKCWKATDKESELVFRILDIDRTSFITLDQYHAAWADFFFNEDPKSKVKIYSNLVNYKRPEDYGVIDCGPCWEGKMRTMFRRLDVTENGKLTCNDFIEIARGISTRGHLDKKKADNVMRTMLNIWVKYVAIDKEGKHHAEITEKEFVHNIRQMINKDFRHEIDQFGWTFFKAVETEGSGFLTLQEYRNLQEAWHVGREEADAMFKILDIDKDGKISHDEYLNAWIDYFLGEDTSSPFKSFFGSIRQKP